MWKTSCSLVSQLIPSTGLPVATVAVPASAGAEGTGTPSGPLGPGAGAGFSVPSVLSEASLSSGVPRGAGGLPAAARHGQRDGHGGGDDDHGRADAGQPVTAPFTGRFLGAHLGDLRPGRSLGSPCSAPLAPLAGFPLPRFAPPRLPLPWFPRPLFPACLGT